MLFILVFSAPQPHGKIRAPCTGESRKTPPRTRQRGCKKNLTVPLCCCCYCSWCRTPTVSIQSASVPTPIRTRGVAIVISSGFPFKDATLAPLEKAGAARAAPAPVTAGVPLGWEPLTVWKEEDEEEEEEEEEEGDEEDKDPVEGKRFKDLEPAATGGR